MHRKPHALPPPPADKNWEILTRADGHRFYMVWPQGMDRDALCAKVLVALYGLAHPVSPSLSVCGQLYDNTEDTPVTDESLTTL